MLIIKKLFNNKYDMYIVLNVKKKKKNQTICMNKIAYEKQTATFCAHI